MLAYRKTATTVAAAATRRTAAARGGSGGRAVLRSALQPEQRNRIFGDQHASSIVSRAFSAVSIPSDEDKDKDPDNRYNRLSYRDGFSAGQGREPMMERRRLRDLSLHHAFERNHLSPTLPAFPSSSSSVSDQMLLARAESQLCSMDTLGRYTNNYRNEYNNSIGSGFVLHQHPQAMRNLMYTSTVRALHTSGIDPNTPFVRTLHRVVHKACFSTSPPADDRKDTASTTTSSSSSTSSTTSTLNEPDKKSYAAQATDAIKSATKAIVNFLMQLPGWTWFYLTHPKELQQRMQELWEAAKKEAHHYWMGTKLLYADVQTASKMLGRLIQGSTLSRRERKQLLRTVSDLFRLVPFSMFIIIPFMEFALPFALRLFPNMLPSTFQDSLKAEENMKRELKSRIAMAQFFQE